MKITVLFVQRKDTDELVEAVAVTDEYQMDDNPEWWTTEVESQLEAIGSDVLAHREVELDIDDDALAAIFKPRLQATVRGNHHG